MNIVASFSRSAVGRPGSRVVTRVEEEAGTYRTVTRWTGDYGPRMGMRRVHHEGPDRAEAVEAWREERAHVADLPTTTGMRTEVAA